MCIERLYFSNGDDYSSTTVKMYNRRSKLNVTLYYVVHFCMTHLSVQIQKVSNHFRKTLYLRCLAAFLIDHLCNKSWNFAPTVGQWGLQNYDTERLINCSIIIHSMIKNALISWEVMNVLSTFFKLFFGQ